MVGWLVGGWLVGWWVGCCCVVVLLFADIGTCAAAAGETNSKTTNINKHNKQKRTTNQTKTTNKNIPKRRTS